MVSGRRAGSNDGIMVDADEQDESQSRGINGGIRIDAEEHDESLSERRKDCIGGAVPVAGRVVSTIETVGKSGNESTENLCVSGGGSAGGVHSGGWAVRSRAFSALRRGWDMGTSAAALEPVSCHLFSWG